MLTLGGHLDAATGNKTLLKGHPQIVDSVVFSRDGKMLAPASRDNTISLWDVSTDKEITTLELYPRGHRLLVQQA